MDESLEALIQRLRALEDIAAIKELKAAYWQCIDRQQPALLRELLAADVALDMEGVPCGEREAYSAIVERAGCRPGLFNLHAGQNSRIRLTGADTAEGHWDALFTSIDVGERLTIQMSCDYRDRYRRIDGRWWIAAMTVRQTSFLMQRIDGEGKATVLSMGQNNAAAFDR